MKDRKRHARRSYQRPEDDAIHIYVRHYGSDRRDGTGIHSPLRTLDVAMQRVNEALGAGTNQDLVIEIGAGRYELKPGIYRPDECRSQDHNPTDPGSGGGRRVKR
jgi:hypothetical protein